MGGKNMRKFLAIFVTVLAVVGFSFGVIACEPVELDEPMFEEPVDPVD